VIERRKTGWGSIQRAGLAGILSLSVSTLFSYAQSPITSSSITNDPTAKVPGHIINHSPASSGLYIGSPSIAVLPNGDYVASHDFFGPKSREHERATSLVFRSSDRGTNWTKISEINGAFWSSLFVHRGALYLIGPQAHHGKIYIRRSMDGGLTWTSPNDSHTGVLRDDGQYHCAPMPVLEHAGRLWRAFEKRDPPGAWGTSYRAGVLFASVDTDLLEATNWLSSHFLPSNKSWNNADMGGWLEGNVVATPQGQLVDVLRVDTRGYPELAAIVNISIDGQTTSFDPATDFVRFPGGAKKFTIRFDPRSNSYWSLATVVLEKHQKGRPAGIRNTLALTSSKDLRNWTIRCQLLYHPDVLKHGFQYPDWLFDGEDIISVVRTAFDDTQGGAHDKHDANFLTFHRWRNFRQLEPTSDPGRG
jgi:hypothetical protein